MAKKRQITKKHVYKVGDLVLAKLKGHSEWPAKLIEIQGPGKYTVRFYHTEDVGKNVTLKPYDSTSYSRFTGKKENLKEAYRKCQEEYEKTICTSPENGTSTLNQSEPDTNDVKLEKTETESQPAQSPESDEIDSQAQDPDGSSIPAPTENDNKGASKLNPTSVDCSLNDLTSEKANADRGLKKTPSKSKIAHDKTNETRTIEKLRKKLQKKLDEKEDKKRSRIERKRFEKASSMLHQKFVSKFRLLTQRGEQFINNSKDQRNAIQLKTSIENCHKSLGVLIKCIETLMSEYGRSRKESKEFHEVFESMVTCLIEVKKMKVQPASKSAKILIKKFRADEWVKNFYNNFKQTLACETKEESVVERKENARKRMKLSRFNI